MLLLDGDYSGAAVAELKGGIAADVDGAYVEQSYAEVWAEDQIFKINAGGLLSLVVVGGQSIVLILVLGDHGSALS